MGHSDRWKFIDGKIIELNDGFIEVSPTIGATMWRY
jgi:hypothetical protein